MFGNAFGKWNYTFNICIQNPDSHLNHSSVLLWAQVKDISLSEINNQGASDLLAVSSSFTITESVAAVGESHFSKIH